MPPRCEACSNELPLRGDRRFQNNHLYCKTCLSGPAPPKKTVLPQADGCARCRTKHVRPPYRYCYFCYQMLTGPEKYIERVRLAKLPARSFTHSPRIVRSSQTQV